MTQTKQQQAELRDLPEPIVLTRDQLKEVASTTASGVPQVAGGGGDPTTSGYVRALR